VSDSALAPAEPTSDNCAGFRLRGPWRRPSDLTSALSRLVLAHESRQAESSETANSLGAMRPFGP
jgi:hypothetical protein